MKAVINNCYGGFSLSPLAITEYCKRIGKPIFFYKQTKDEYSDGIDEYEKIINPDSEHFLSSLHTDLGDKTNNIENGEWFWCREIPRDDKNLIAVVKNLGKKANGSCASLKIIEIPDGVEWEIDEYDGMECVEEKHRFWR